MTFQPGQKVYFRLGERVPVQMSCCGDWVDVFEYLKEWNGQVFYVIPFAIPVCPLCRSVNNSSGDNKIILQLEKVWVINEVAYTTIGVYPQELELLEDQDDK